MKHPAAIMQLVAIASASVVTVLAFASGVKPNIGLEWLSGVAVGVILYAALDYIRSR